MSNQLTVIDEVRNAIIKMQPQFAMVLPSHIPAEKFQRVALTAIQNTPSLLEADRRSLYSACMKAAQDGLIPDGREAALVTFNTKSGKVVQYMPMIGGILKKVRQSGDLSTLHAAVVYANDKFRYWVDSDGQHIEHEPQLFGDRGKAIGVYAMAKTKDGSVAIEPMSITDVEKVRNASRSKDSGPWQGWWDEMAKKSALRRLSKYLPQSTDIESTLRADDELFMPETAETVVVEQQEEHPKTAKKTRLDKVKEQAVIHDVETGEIIEHETHAQEEYNPEDVL